MEQNPSKSDKTRKMLIDGIKALFMLGAGLLMFAFWHSCSDDASTQGKVTTTSNVPTPAKTVAWDGNPNHADCSPGVHPDPKHPGDLISDEDEGEDEDKPCIPNAPIPPPVDPLADGAAPDAAHCFGPGWGTLPDETEGDRKCNPMRQRQLAKDERVQKVFGETASHARWIDGPDTKRGDLDEFYELPGEDGQNACAEVTHSALGDNAYTVSVLNANHDVRMSTQHMAELAAVSVCGNGRHP